MDSDSLGGDNRLGWLIDIASRLDGVTHTILNQRHPVLADTSKGDVLGIPAIGNTIAIAITIVLGPVAIDIKLEALGTTTIALASEIDNCRPGAGIIIQGHGCALPAIAGATEVHALEFALHGRHNIGSDSVVFVAIKERDGIFALLVEQDVLGRTLVGNTIGIIIAVELFPVASHIKLEALTAFGIPLTGKL